MPDDIVLQTCRDCARVWYFERRYCPSCGADRPRRVPSAGTGTVRAATTVHRSSGRSDPPRHVVLVDLAEGVRVMGAATRPLAVGSRVRGVLREADRVALPYFEEDAS